MEAHGVKNESFFTLHSKRNIQKHIKTVNNRSRSQSHKRTYTHFRSSDVQEKLLEKDRSIKPFTK